jgi:hypothetical protein
MLKNTPTPFDGIIFTMIRRIIGLDHNSVQDPVRR